MSAFDLGAVSTFRDLRVDKAQALKPLEEAAEVFGAWQHYRRICDLVDEGACAPEDEARTALLDECADVCQAVANLLAALGVDGDEWAAAVGRCEKRNRERGRY